MSTRTAKAILYTCWSDIVQTVHVILRIKTAQSSLTAAYDRSASGVMYTRTRLGRDIHLKEVPGGLKTRGRLPSYPANERLHFIHGASAGSFMATINSNHVPQRRQYLLTLAIRYGHVHRVEVHDLLKSVSVERVRQHVNHPKQDRTEHRQRQVFSSLAAMLLTQEVQCTSDPCQPCRQLPISQHLRMVYTRWQTKLVS